MKRSPLAGLPNIPAAHRAAPSQASLHLEDFSAHERLGLKGPNAEGWLRAQGYALPSAPNSGRTGPNGTSVARLGWSEFLVEFGTVAPPSKREVEVQLCSSVRPADVYPVARCDCVIGLSGARLRELLPQVCSVDFAPLFSAARAPDESIVMTTMLGVSVLAWPRSGEAGASLVLWLDPSFAHYFWTTLIDVGRGVGTMTLGITT